MPSVRKKVGIIMSVFLPRCIQFGCGSGLASRGRHAEERSTVTTDENHVLCAPCSFPAWLITHQVHWSACNGNLLESALSEKRDVLAIRRPEWTGGVVRTGEWLGCGGIERSDPELSLAFDGYRKHHSASIGRKKVSSCAVKSAALRRKHVEPHWPRTWRRGKESANS